MNRGKKLRKPQNPDKRLCMNANKKILFLGGSRGFGAAVAQQCTSDSEISIVSRKTKPIALDFSKTESLEKLVPYIFEFKPNRIFYFAGGGPFGKFECKDWRDHQWALEVNFLFPARLLHKTLNEFSFVEQFVIIGSQIAEESAHPLGASYAAAKCAIKSMINSIVDEKPSLDIRLFSPGYMDTELLPKNAYPRREKRPILSTSFAAEKFLNWVNEKNGKWHYILSSDGSVL